jgi:hypothetical protein
MRQQRVWMPLPQVADSDRREAAHEHLGISANVCVRSLLFVETAHEGDQLLVPIGESAPEALGQARCGLCGKIDGIATRTTCLR